MSAADLYKQGNALRDQNKYQEAIETYDKALALNANFAEALYDKGLALHNLNKFQEAIDCYEKAIAINNKYSDAFTFKGVVSDFFILIQKKKSYQFHNYFIRHYIVKINAKKLLNVTMKL
jgi:tetratricopeptide (TPR) repeat protein